MQVSLAMQFVMYFTDFCKK